MAVQVAALVPDTVNENLHTALLQASKITANPEN